MPFQLSDTVNKEKVFLVRRSELEGRIDPYFYKPVFAELRNRLKRLKFIPLNQVILSWNRGDGPREGFYTDDEENGVVFLRVNNLKNHSVDLQDCKFITRTVHEKTLKRAQVTAGDIVFAISGTKDNLGTVSIVPNSIKEANLNSAIVRIDLDESKIEKEFFCYLFDLKFIRNQIEFIGKGAAQNNLNNDEINQIHIPGFSLENQRNIVSILNNAIAAKKQKEAQAQQLLDSIDTYLLNELGIEAKADNPNTIENRIVKSSFRCVTGQRWDPLFHCGDMFAFIRNAQSCIDFPQLNNLVQYFQTGFAAGRDDQGDECSGIIQIRPTNINDNRELVFHRNVYIDASEVNTRKADVLNRDEVLFNNTNSQEQVGKTSYFDLEGDYFCSNHITRIATKAELLNPKYLWLILNLYQHQKCFFKLCTNWNNQSGVGVDVLQKIPIPLPPLEKQNEIAAHIQTIRDHAKQLRAEATAGLEQAKREVESMILGEGGC